MEKNITLQVADGTEMAAYVAYPDKGTINSPALLLFQEAFGVNQHIRHVADMFASEGFIVIAPELFHRTAPKGWEGDYSNFQSAMPHYQALTNEGLEADIKASYQWLIEQKVVVEEIYSIGYCLGGKVSFLANAVLPLKAGVSYYGGGVDQLVDKAANVSGKHLFFWGGKDQHIKAENINTITNALDAAGKDYVNVKFSYADHAFSCDDRPNYNPTATKQALALTLAFLKE
ncbi:MAG TPA: dienelactone hydrolase family protein [Mucilaginibacter sp.]